MAQLGTLEYLITIDSSKISSGLSAAEGKVKGFGNKLSAWAVAKGQMIGNLVSKAASSTVSFVSDSIGERREFDKAMSQVAATLGKSVSEMNNEIGSVDTSFGHFNGTLTEFARYMGANTAYTATEAAQALNYMALAGYDTQKSMNMLPNVLNLAAAGNFDLARASDMVTDAQSALGLTTRETEVLVDQMAKTSSKTNTSVEQLGDAILTVGGTAKTLKGGTKELNAVLGVLADNGIKGSEGGTALRNVLTSLSAPTKKAKSALKELGVEVFDQFGNMRELPDIMTDFNKATEGMSDQKRSNILSKIFNKRDLKSIEALLGTTTERWQELYGEITNSEGSAAQMAETQLDNLEGDTVKFNSALSEAKLTLVEGLTPALRNFTQRGTALVQRLTAAFKTGGFKGVIDATRQSVLNLMAAWTNSENPVKRGIGRMVTALSNGLSWDNLKEAVTAAWDTVKAGVAGLGKIVFGENVDGSIKWPTWESIGESVTAAWNKICEEAAKLKGFVFGDAATASDIISKIQTGWESLFQTVQDKVVDIISALFGESDPATIKSAVEGISSGLKAAGIAIATYFTIEKIQGIITFFNNIKTLFTTGVGGSKIGLIIAAIAAAFTLIVDNWDVIEPKLKEFGEIIDKNILEPLRQFGTWVNDNIVSPINDAIDRFKELLGLNTPTEMHNGSGGKLSQAQVDNLAWEYANRVKDDLGNYNNSNFTSALKSDMEAAGFSANEIESAVNAITSGTISPSDITTFLSNLESASAAAADAKTQLDGIPGEYNATINVTTKGAVALPKAKGDWNVPYDNYIAALHRGEMVLTASQARKYREGSTGGIDVASLYDSILGAIRDGMDGATVNSYMNGNKVSRETNRATGNLIAARRFATT